MQGSNSVKSSLMAMFTFVCQTGVGIIMLPSLLAKDTGHDGWISILVTGIIVALLSVMIVVLLRRYKDKAIYDINKFIFGRIIGSGFNVLLILYLLIATVGGASLFNYFMRITILPETPSWALAPFITLPTFYLVWQGLKHVSRFLFCSLLSYVVVLVFIALLYKEYRISFLMPIGEAGITRILYSTKTSFFAFIGFELIAFIYPYISDRNKALKWHILAIMASTVFFLVIVIVSTAIFGENFLTTLFLPFYNLSRIYNAPILERIDLYLIALWFIPMACSMRCYVFAAFDGLQKVFNLEKTRLLYVIFFIVIYIFSSIPKDINQVFVLIELINMIGIGVALFLVLCLLLSFIRKKGVTSK